MTASAETGRTAADVVRHHQDDRYGDRGFLNLVRRFESYRGH